ncbi:hypothetical protein EI94DRAFT_1703590 [Lactarius quietus]|nr:hypothetical protein EI94DRAFT_1703590 [Lactarius quietus]
MSCTQVGILPLDHLLWICTCWGSLYNFLEHFIKLKPAIIQFILLADASEAMPSLPKKRYYVDFHMNARDWESLGYIRDALHFLIKHWETMAGQPACLPLKVALNKGIESLHKWYGWVDSTSPAYFICLVLDPNVKDIYFWHGWDNKQYFILSRRQLTFKIL